MRTAAGGLVVSSLRTLIADGSQNARALACVPMRQYADAGKRSEDSSTSNWGTGEPPIDEKQTQRGVSRDQTSGMNQNTGTAEVGRHSEPTSTSNFDTGETSNSPAGTSRGKESKKSRTGQEMSDEGQVHTPHLGRMRTTRDMIQDKGKETEDRLSSSGSKPT